MSTALDAAMVAVHVAGKIIRRKLPDERAVTTKGWRDIVTDADLASQQAILTFLTRSFPDHGILSEETPSQTNPFLDGRPFWLVDPLDGTTNFANRFPGFAVAIALVVGREPIVGVVHDPLRHETFYAEKGRGAFLQRSRCKREALRVSAQTEFRNAVVGVDWPRDPVVRARALAAYARVITRCCVSRTLGSVALGLAYMAAGWVDAYYHFGLQPWDVVASALVAQEAGAVITALDGSPWQVDHSAIAVSNGRIHADLLTALATDNESTDSVTPRELSV